MHFTKSAVLEKILALLVCISIGLIICNNIDSGHSRTENKLTEISDGWYYVENGQKTYVSLPCTLTLQSDKDLVLYNDGISGSAAGKMLTTRGAVYHLKITLADKTLYQYNDDSFPRNDQMSSKVYCSANIPHGFESETIALTYTNTQKGNFNIKKIYSGTPLQVFLHLCYKDASSLLIVFILAILAVITVCISLYLKHMHLREKRFADISYFLLFCSCWFLTDSSFAQMLSGSSPVIRYISFYAFMLLAIPMLHFIKNTEGMKNYRVIDIIIYLFYGNVIVQSLLNYFGVFDFIDMLFVTHILLFGGSAVIMVLLVSTCRKNDDKELSSILISFAVVAGGGVLSLLLYWILKISFYELFFEAGIVIFIILLIRMLIIAMVDNLRFRTESIVYQRLAKEDPMTGLQNRRAFDEYLEEIEKNLNSYNSLLLIFMDVNHLKLINDTHGHNAGDELIIAASRCIEKAFGSNGACFRIGGDEFCAVLPDTSLSENELSDLLDEELRTYNKNSSRYQISLARGISNIRNEKGSLKTISDWKREADLKMYDNKGWVKRTGNGGRK